MGEVINLRAARKARDRMKATAQADANRARFGRSKAEKQADAAEIIRRQQLLDGVRRGDDGASDPSG